MRDEARLHFAGVPERDHVVGRLADHAEVGPDAAVAVKMFETDAVAVLLADGACHPNGLAFEQAELLRRSRRADRRGQAAFHVHGAAAVEHAVLDLAGKGRMLPFVCVLGQHGVHVRIEVDHPAAAADAAANVARGVDVGFIIPQFLHFGEEFLRQFALLIGIAARFHGRDVKIQQVAAVRFVPEFLSDHKKAPFADDVPRTESSILISAP